MLRKTQLAENSLLLMAEDAEFGSVGGGYCENRIIKKSLLISKNSNGAMSYLTPSAKQAFTQLR